MRKISNWKQKLTVTVCYLGAVGLFYLLKVPCLLLRVFHVPCPGCGMTRALFAALRLDFAAAFYLHPMFWSVPVLYLYFLFDGGLFPGKRTNNIMLCLIGVGFLVQWVLKLLQHPMLANLY